MMKRVISLVLCLIMAVSLFSGFALADNTPENGWYGDGHFWMESDGNEYECMYYYRDGEPVTGWQYIDGEWYYFKQYGTYDIGLMFRDAIADEYYLGYDGAMKVNHWRQVLEMHTNIIQTEDGYWLEEWYEPYDPPRWQYFDENGKQAYGWEYIDGEWYYFREGERGTDNNGGLRIMDEWEQINGNWYRFDGNGVMLTGWLREDDVWYYLKSWGGMAKDEWEKINGKWYLFDEDGEMLTGWQTVDGEKYYLSESGAMVTGKQVIDGELYRFDSSGALTTETGTIADGWSNAFGPWMYRQNGEWYKGWLYYNGYWYYLYDGPTMGNLWASYGPGMDTGIMLDDTFLVKNGRAYYFDESGRMVTGWKWIDGEPFYFDNSGRLQEGWVSVPGYEDYEVEVEGGVATATRTWTNYYYVSNGSIQTGWENVDGVWYYLNPETGIMADDGWQEIGGYWYYFRSWGGMLTGWLQGTNAWYYLKSWGGMAEDEWEKINGKWYLFDENGRMLTGWQEDDGEKYYLSESGAMVTGTQVIDGVTYVFDASGALVANTY